MKQLLLLTILILPIDTHRAQDRTVRETSAPLVTQSTLGMPRYTLLNINTITAWLRSDGQSAHSPRRNEGVIYPRGTAWVVYQDGFLWAGKAFLDPGFTTPAPPHTIRVGGQTYNVGTREGWVVGSGADAMPVDPSHPDARIYRIRRDYTEIGEYELQKDAAEYYELDFNNVTASHFDQIRNQYHTDWTEWPVDRGAPYIERNGTPGYQPPPPLGSGFSSQDLITGNYDEPGIAGSDPSVPADQVVWTVYNDLNATFTTSLYGSQPLGLEAHVTMWGYRRPDALGNMYFQRLRIINKGGVDVGGGVRQALWIDSMFIGKWVDTDIGHFGDDLLGCDPAINLAFAYNATSSDQHFQRFGIPSPSVGWNILQGPIVPGNTGDTATFNFRTVHGKRNLGMTSYSPKAVGQAFGDPPFTYEGALQWWRWIQGYLPEPSTTPWRLYPHPPGVPVTKFPLSGDPVTRTGFIDGLGTIYSLPPGSRRHTLSTGPFALAPGDTQEVIIAVIGGLGADHLTSITAMKFNDRTARQMQATRFASHRPPSPPKVQTIELDGEIILEWGSDLQRVRETEEPVYAGGYAFEGYTVYQLPRRNASLEEGKRIATFDVVNGVATIIEDMFDPNTGLVVPVLLQEGTDAGVQRHLSITRNHLAEFGVPSRLFNGQEYYFAVTVYSYSAQGSYPKSLESAPEVHAVRPRVPFGMAVGTAYGDTLPVTRAQGRSDGDVFPIVVNPLAGTGDTYEVRFDTAGSQIVWSLRNASKDTTLFGGKTNQSGDANYDFVEGGILLKVIGPPPGLRDWSMPNSEPRFTVDEFTSQGIVWGEPAYHFGITTEPSVKAHQLKRVLLKLAPASSGPIGNPNAGNNPYGGWDLNDPNLDENFSYAYRYLRGATAAPARPEFAPFIVNPSPGYAYQDYKRGVPVSAWNVDADPPERLAVGIHENNAAMGLVDGKWWPPSSGTGVLNSTVRDYLFIFDRPYTGETPVAELQIDALNNPLPVMWWVALLRRANTNFHGGEELLITVNRANLPEDVFRYTVPVVETSALLQKADAGRVGVFPNPYYAGQTEGPFSQGRFVTFNNVPPKVIIRIYNLAGHLVRTLRKDEPSQFLVWDLKNENDWLIASGMYLCHVEMPEIGEVKILKLAVIQDAVIPPVR